MKIRRMVLAALFAAMLAISGQISIPIGPVPITWQTLVVMLSGLLLGPQLGALSILVFIALAAIGLPILSGGAGGIGALFGPTGGFVLSWPVASFVIGWLTHRLAKKKEIKFWHLLPINLLGGVLVVYLIGVPWLMGITNLSYSLDNLIQSCLIFLPGDLIKIFVASFLAITVYRVDPSLRPSSSQQRKAKNTPL